MRSGRPRGQTWRFEGGGAGNPGEVPTTCWGEEGRGVGVLMTTATEDGDGDALTAVVVLNSAAAAVKRAVDG